MPEELPAEGPRDCPLALLLHGFPELSRSWRHQLPAFAAAGVRAGRGPARLTASAC